MIVKYVADGLYQYKSEHYTRTFQEAFKDHPPTFTLGGFQRKNVIVRTPSHGDLEVVLIDCEIDGGIRATGNMRALSLRVGGGRMTGTSGWNAC
jgi:hypothetical protein